MSDNGSIHVDFQQVKQVVSIPDALHELGIVDQFVVREHTVSGVCPLPTHEHNPIRPNPQQWKADDKKGVWLWKCFSSDCDQGGDVIGLVKYLTGLSNEHVRLWFWDRFSDRLTNGKPKRQKQEKEHQQADTKKADEGETVVESQSSPTDVTPNNVSDCLPKLKPLRWEYRLDQRCDYLLRDRKLKPETIDRYGIGRCIKAKAYLSGYIAIPIYLPEQADDAYPVAYLGRYAGEKEVWTDDEPRYKFWNEFPRNSVIYGLREALRDSDDGAPLLILEGPFKCFWLYQELGLTNVVATFSASLSNEQAEILAATNRPLVLMWDGNAQQAARLAAAKLISHSSLRVVKLDEDVEPDQLPTDKLRDLLSFML